MGFCAFRQESPHISQINLFQHVPAQHQRAFGWGTLARKVETRLEDARWLKELAVHSEDGGSDLQHPCKCLLGMAAACDLSTGEAEMPRAGLLDRLV